MRHRFWGLVACTIVLGLGGIGAAGCGSEGPSLVTPGDSDVVTPGDETVTGSEGGDEVVPPAAVAEDCAVVGDEDGDGVADCVDTDCASDPACALPPPAIAEGDCGDGVDGDFDGDFDCADSDCSADPVCSLPPPVAVEDCATASDEDGDGQGQCGDTDCVGDPACTGGGDDSIYTIHPDYFERFQVEKKPWPGPGPECLSCPYDFGIRKDAIANPEIKYNLDARDYGF